MKRVWTGIESSGKSLQLAIQAEAVLKRNIKWLRITGEPRTMAFNQPMSAAFVKRVEDAGIKYLRWTNFIEIEHLDNVDIFMDEVIKYFPATGSQPLTAQQMNFLSQGAKTGVYLYAASQDFSQVHKQFRLLVNQVFVVSKIIGSRRPMRTAPPVKRVWGLCMAREVRPMSFKGDNATMDSISIIPHFFFIERRHTELFDTTHKIPITVLPPKVVRKQELIGYDESGEVAYRKITWV